MALQYTRSHMHDVGLWTVLRKPSTDRPTVQCWIVHEVASAPPPPNYGTHLFLEFYSCILGDCMGIGYWESLSAELKSLPRRESQVGLTMNTKHTSIMRCCPAVGGRNPFTERGGAIFRLRSTNDGVLIYSNCRRCV